MGLQGQVFKLVSVQGRLEHHRAQHTYDLTVAIIAPNNVACVNFKHSVDHHAWPQNGNLAIENCLRACGYCSLGVQSSNALRKHVARCHLGPGRALHGEVHLMPGKVGRPPPLPKDTAVAPATPAVAATGNHDDALTLASTTAHDPGSDDAVPADLAEDNTARKEASLEVVMSMLHRLDQHVVELAEVLRGSIPGTLQRANNELDGSIAKNVELGASMLRRKVRSAVSGKGKQVASGSRSSGRNRQGPSRTRAGGSGSGSDVPPASIGHRDISYFFISGESDMDMDDEDVESGEVALP